MTIHRILMKFSQRVHTSLKTYNIEKKQSKNTMQYGLDTAIRTQTQNRTLFYAEIVTAFK
jgi:hypothetical protein